LEIVLVIRGKSNEPLKTSFVYGLRGLTGASIVEIRDRAANGIELCRFRLYGNDHDSVAAGLRECIEFIMSTDEVQLDMYEVNEGKVLDGANLAVALITVEQLDNILQAHQQTLDRLRELDELGHR
jgi:hypothetical protein